MEKIKFIFYHIEKCGGSSLRLSFYNYFSNFINKKNIFIPEKNNNIKMQFNKYYYENELESLKSNKNYNFNDLEIILCHVRYNDFKHIEKNIPLKVTFLREPIERVISHYYFFTKNKFNCELIDLDENEFNKFCTFHGTYMSKSVLNCVDKDNNIDLKILKDRYNEFLYIGLLENIENDTKILNKKLNNYFNVNYNLNVETKNVNKKNIKDYEKLKKKIEPFCKNDIIMYNYIKKKNNN